MPERSLWAAVLARLIADATGPKPTLDRHQARHILRPGSHDLRLICDLAGFDPDAVLDRYSRMTNKFRTGPHQTRGRAGTQYDQARMRL